MDSAVQAVAVSLVARRPPTSAAMFGARRLSLFALLLVALALFLFIVWPRAGASFSLRIVLGILAEMLFVSAGSSPEYAMTLKAALNPTPCGPVTLMPSVAYAAGEALL